MIKMLNVVSRIDRDKDFFVNYLEVISILKFKYNIIFNIKIIGNVYDEDVYHKLIEDIRRLDIISQVEITKKSIPFSKLFKTENDYYINACIGDYVGYSSIECIENEMKTIFFNISENKIDSQNISFCNTIDDLVILLLNLFSNDEVNIRLKNDNQLLLERFMLDDLEKINLLSILKGSNI